jgi:hypothetical protein
MTNVLRAAYRYWAAVIFLAVLVQVGAAGYGAFNADKKANDTNALTHKAFDHGFNFHIGLGYLLFVGGVILFLLALGARLGRHRVLLALGLALLVLLAIVLAITGGKHPVVGILHPLDAFLVLGLSGYLAHAAWSRAGGSAA